LEDALQRAGITGRSITRGEIYWVQDDVIQFPKQRLPNEPERKMHDNRPVIVLQTDLDNSNPAYPIVLIAPISHKVQFKDDKDVKLTAGQGGLPENSLVHLGLMQPILKIELGMLIGKLDPVAMSDIDAVVAANLGLSERPSASPI
jgi:mRNA-degrading endonuclease toxin of MazEF toxin-antitoxin module